MSKEVNDIIDEVIDKYKCKTIEELHRERMDIHQEKIDNIIDMIGIRDIEIKTLKLKIMGLEKDWYNGKK